YFTSDFVADRAALAAADLWKLHAPVLIAAMSEISAIIDSGCVYPLIAMRRSGSITLPLSLTSGGRRSLLLSDDAVCEARCVGPCSGSAISRACAPVLISVAGGLRSNKGLSLPRPRRIRPAETTHPARSKAGKRIITSARW